MNWIKLSERSPENTYKDYLISVVETREYWSDTFISKTEKRSVRMTDHSRHSEIDNFDSKEAWEKRGVTHWCEIQEPKQ